MMPAIVGSFAASARLALVQYVGETPGIRAGSGVEVGAVADAATDDATSCRRDRLQARRLG